ncbi:MAG: hypothetical protein E6G14_01220 [Actinobacteria bacterium]|nr:MAG: hypothetical protein E6G14_01220 [Actinomycetota bacterium]
MSGYDEERIAERLRVLPPAPIGWVEAAQELPRARAEIAGLVERAQADAGYRAQLLADIETALAAEGLVPRPSLIELVRRRMSE